MAQDQLKFQHLQTPNRASSRARDKLNSSCVGMEASECVTPETYAERVQSPTLSCTTYVEFGGAKKLKMLEDASCRSSQCLNRKTDLESRVEVLEKQVEVLEKTMDEMLQEKAEILLRALTGEMERTACWLELSKLNRPEFEWQSVTTFKKLEQIGGDVDAARRQLAKWWSSDYNSDMDMTEVHSILRPMYNMRLNGNMKVHPFFAELQPEQLLKLAKLAKGDAHQRQWPLLIGWRQMREDMQNEKLRRFFESVELEDLSKLHLDRFEIEPTVLRNFIQEMELRTRPQRT